MDKPEIGSFNIGRELDEIRKMIEMIDSLKE